MDYEFSFRCGLRRRHCWWRNSSPSTSSSSSSASAIVTETFGVRLAGRACARVGHVGRWASRRSLGATLSSPPQHGVACCWQTSPLKASDHRSPARAAEQDVALGSASKLASLWSVETCCQLRHGRPASSPAHAHGMLLSSRFLGERLGLMAWFVAQTAPSPINRVGWPPVYRYC